MRNFTIITAAIVALTAAASANGPPPPKHAPKRVFMGLSAGYGHCAAKENRVAASGWGPVFRCEFGYRLNRWLTVPYVTAGATWGRGDVPEWEADGYPKTARYFGLFASQIIAGGYFRYPLIGDTLGAYAGPAFLAAWQRREVQTWYRATMDENVGSGLGWAAVAGVEFAPGGAQTLCLQILYGQTYSAWSDLPTGAEDGFTFDQLQIGGALRFFLF
jgi:opacity protein-like surface antigen